MVEHRNARKSCIFFQSFGATYRKLQWIGVVERLNAKKIHIFGDWYGRIQEREVKLHLFPTVRRHVSKIIID